MTLKTEGLYEHFSSDKEVFDFSNYSTKLKYYDNSNKLIIGKKTDESQDVAVEEFVRLKPKMYLFLVDNSDHNKTKGLYKNIVAAINHNEYKDVLFNNKCIRHWMIEFKVKNIRTYEIDKVSLSCFCDKIYIQSNGYGGLALGY